MEATFSRQHTVNGILNTSWKSRMTLSGCWRSSRNRTVCVPRHDVRYRGPHNSAVADAVRAPLTAALRVLDAKEVLVPVEVIPPDGLRSVPGLDTPQRFYRVLK